MDSSKLDMEFHKEVYETLARHESCFHRVNATLQAVLSELQTMSISRNTKLWSFGNPTPSQGDIRSNVCNGQQVRASFHLSREEKEIPDPVYDEYPDEDEEVISQNIFSLPLFSPVSNSTDLDKAYWLLKPVTLASKKVAPEEKKIKDMSHERFTAVRARIPKRVLLVGPPETGKTLLTQAIVGEACSPLAGENGVPFFSASGSELDETIVGVGTLWAHDLFKKAKENVYCIVRTDEIDAVEQQRRTGIGDRAVEEVTLEAIIVCTHRIPGLRSKRVDLIKPRQSAFTKVAFKAVSEAVAAPAKFAQVSNVVITLSSSEGLSAESKLKTTFTKASKTVLRIYDDKRYKSESKKGVLRSVDICGLGAEPEIKKETHGLAVVNMDSWYVKVVDLYVLWSSIVPPNGQIKIVTVYSFEFGLQQMKEEEVHGFVGLFNDEAAKSDEDNNDNYIDKERLHTYEKSKMRYYYAVVGWDSSTTTDNIYKECDGLEFTQSSNALDLNEWFIHIKHLTRDVATEAPAKYECRDFYTRALQQGLNSNIYVGSSLVNMYGKYLLVDAAKKVIDGIDGKYIVIWNAMLGGYAKNEYVDEVMELFFSMTRCGIDPDEFTYTSILSSCTSLGYQEMGHQLYSITAKERFTSNFSCNAIIVEMQSHLSKFKVECRDAADLNGWGNVEQQPGGVVMLKVLDNLLPDLIYSENLVSSWKAVWVIEALKLKDAMVNSGIPMNIEIATSLMKGNSMLGDVTSALQGLNKVVEVGLTLNEVTFFVSIDLYSQTGNVEKAYEIFSQKKLLGILHTSFVVNHLLKGFLKRHLQKDACKLFDEPFEHGMANMVTYIVLLSGFCDEGKVNEICNLWDKMIGKRIVPSLVSYNNITTGPGYSTELMKIDMGGSAMNSGAAKALRQIKPLRVEVHYVVAAGCIAKQIHEWYTLEEFRGMPTISLGGVFFSMELPSYESSKSAPPEHMYLDSSLRTRILKRGRNDVFSLATCPCSSGATLARVFGWLSQIVVSNQ